MKQPFWISFKLGQENSVSHFCLIAGVELLDCGYMLILVGHDERRFSLHLNITKGHYINSAVGKRFFHDIISLYIIIAYSILISFTILVSTVKYPAGNCMFGVGDGGAGAACGVCSRLAMKTPERRHWRRAGVFIVDFGRGWRIVLVFLLLTLGRKMPAGY